jgi:16S rRNA G1207 methylase RsmC
MSYLTKLFSVVRERAKSPIAILHGPPRAVAYLVQAINQPNITCFQLDLFPAARLREALVELGATAEVVVGADPWDLPKQFQSVILPATAHTDRELKIDLVEQGSHILVEGGVFLTLSEYERDSEMVKIHKRMFGECGYTPASENGMAFFSTKSGADRARRRHEVNFHAKIGDGSSMNFITRPGVFSYGRFDNGSRALIEVAEIEPTDHVLDLGSGCGAVGCLAWQKCPQGKITFVDSHARAVQLSELNAKANGLSNYEVVSSETMSGLPMSSFNVVLANPPYYGDSVVARLFVSQSRDLLKTGGRFYIVTKMPTAVVPVVFETFGECDVIENRGYSIVTARA